MVGAASRAGASVPAAVGASLALEQAGGRRGAVPVRSALAAATAAVLGVVAATTLVSGINDALHDPARSGRTWKLEVEADNADQVLHPPAVPGLADMALVSRFAATVRGKDVPFYALDELKGAVRFVVLHGRQPVGDDETMIGARSAKVLHVGLGDTIRSDKGGPTLRIVGIGLMTQTPHSTFDEGALMSMKAVDAASGQTFEDREGFLLFSPSPGTKVSSLQAELAKVGLEAAPPAPVADVTNLGQVRSLPYLLAGFLIVLGLGAVAHALMTVSRRRAKELAVLRAVGLSPRQAAACVGWQAVVVAADRAGHRDTRRPGHREGGVAPRRDLHPPRLRRTHQPPGPRAHRACRAGRAARPRGRTGLAGRSPAHGRDAPGRVTRIGGPPVTGRGRRRQRARPRVTAASRWRRPKL